MGGGGWYIVSTHFRGFVRPCGCVCFYPKLNQLPYTDTDKKTYIHEQYSDILYLAFVGLFFTKKKRTFYIIMHNP